MIEVLFGESEAAAMKAAKNSHLYIIGQAHGPTSNWMAGKKRLQDNHSGKGIQGIPQEVICLGFMMDIGDIKKAVDSPYRKDLIYSMYTQEQWGKNPEADIQLREGINLYANELSRLKAYLEQGESIRIWYSDAPYSRCGFYALCPLLQTYKNEVWAVRLPEYSIHPNAIVSYHHWGEIPEDAFAGFLQLQKKLSREELKMYSIIWSRLVEDNSPLRVLLNGELVGVPEDFYDFLIWKSLSESPVKQARLIGDILGHYPVNFGDWWYAKRIDYYIGLKRIRVVKDSQNKYARTICLS